MRALITMLLMILPVLAGAQTIYKHVNEDGSVIFSDEPMSDDAVAMDLPELSVVPGRPELAEVGVEREPAQEEDSGFVAPVYQRLQILRPRQEQTLFAAEGPVRVALELDQPLQVGHMYQIFMDGELVAETSAASVAIEPVYRGEHTLTAQVVDEAGKTLTTSEPVVFFRRQPTVN